jgi:hypothetical protein
MVRNITIFLFFLITLNNCQTTNTPLKKYNYANDLIYIDVVEKKINKGFSAESIYLLKTQKSIIKWLDNNIKTNGFEGYVEIKISDIVTKESITNKNVIIKISAKIEMLISKPTLDRKKIIIIEGQEYGQLNGDFTLNDKSILTDNIIKQLIDKFSVKISYELS